jgi:hypothetical protein
MTSLLSFDPGGTTGWSLSVYYDDAPLTFFDGGQIPDGVDGFVEWWNTYTYTQTGRGVEGFDISYSPLDFDVIVSESFVLDGRTKFPDVTPLRIEGALTALAGTGRVVYQRNVKKALVPDSELKRLGFWVPGNRHQNDARIHALAYAKMNHLPTQQAYWGE